MRLLVSAKYKISKDENGEYITHLEVVDVVLVHCNLVNNDYHRSSSIIYSFVPINVLGNILNIELKNDIFLKTFNSESKEIKVWFTDHNNNPLVVEDNINFTLIIK